MKPVDKKSNKLKAKVVNNPKRANKPDAERPLSCGPRADI